jgi:CheY-like chemotaxis protein
MTETIMMTETITETTIETRPTLLLVDDVVANIDMQIPGMVSEILGRVIQSDKRMADTRTIMLTSSLVTRGDARRFQAIGFAAYLTKPIQRRKLKEVLTLALESGV